MTGRKPLPDGYEHRLYQEIVGAMKREWEWGTHDCVTFSHRCAKAVLNGPTVWDELIPNYQTELGASRKIKSLGGLLAAVDSVCNRIDKRLARRGDIVAIPINSEGEYSEAGQPSLGVVEGISAVFAAYPKGVWRLPVELAIAAWPLEPVE